MTRLRGFLDRPDVRRHRVRFLARRARFELERRFFPGALERLRRVRIDDHLVMLVRAADEIERSVYLYGVHEYLAVEVFKALLRPGDVVVDAGAHVGQYTLIAARRVGPSGRVLACEPLPEHAARLEANVRANGLTNVAVLEIALAASPGEVTLAPSPDPHNTGLAAVTAGGDGIRSRAARVDDLVEEHGIECVHVLKVDVEGNEDAVLAGAEHTLERDRPAVLFEANDERAARRLRAHGYYVYGMRERGASPGYELVRVDAGDDAARFRERWAALNLVALHPAADHPPVSLAH